jgi:hypothetical protein
MSVHFAFRGRIQKNGRSAHTTQHGDRPASRGVDFCAGRRTHKGNLAYYDPPQGASKENDQESLDLSDNLS